MVNSKKVLLVLLSAIMFSCWGHCLCAYGSVSIDVEHFPDDNFRQYVLNNFDSISKDGILSDDKILTGTVINVEYKEISSLKGIEYFTALRELRCSGNQLVSLDLSKNVLLDSDWQNCRVSTQHKTKSSDNFTFSDGIYSLPLSAIGLSSADFETRIRSSDLDVRDRNYTSVIVSHDSGVLRFSAFPYKFKYKYDTKASLVSNRYMDVEITFDVGSLKPMDKTEFSDPVMIGYVADSIDKDVQLSCASCQYPDDHHPSGTALFQCQKTLFASL